MEIAFDQARALDRTQKNSDVILKNSFCCIPSVNAVTNMNSGTEELVLTDGSLSAAAQRLRPTVAVKAPDMTVVM